MKFFCKHEWETVSEKTLPSAFQQMGATMLSKINNAHAWVFNITHILVMKCSKCGKLKKFETISEKGWSG
jgi:hypothetical protein